MNRLILPPHYRKRERGFIINPFAHAVVSASTTWNPADKSTHVTLSGSDLIATLDGFGNPYIVRATSAYVSGDRYFEVRVTVSVTQANLGLALSSLPVDSWYPGDTSASVASRYTGNTYYGGTGGPVPISGGTAWAVGDYVGIRYNGTTFYQYLNGTLQGSFALPNNSWYPYLGCNDSCSAVGTLNCGQSAFYSLPSGATAWG